LAATRFIVTFLLTTVFVSCKKSESDGIPCYYHLLPPQLLNPDGSFDKVNGITDLYVFSQGKNLGVFDSLSYVPDLAEGSVDVSIFAGIKNNSLGQNRIKHPFLQVYDTALWLGQGESYSLAPVFQYASSSNVDVSRNFESGNTWVESTSQTGSVSVVTNSNIALQGVRCGLFQLINNSTSAQFVENNDIAISPGDNVFLELNYSCNNTFGVGVYSYEGASTERVPILFLNPTTSSSELPTWKKVYIDLGMIGVQRQNTNKFRIYIDFTTNETNQPKIYLDNIKVVR
jgi:hypothetical protein